MGNHHLYSDWPDYRFGGRRVVFAARQGIRRLIREELDRRSGD